MMRLFTILVLLCFSHFGNSQATYFNKKFHLKGGADESTSIVTTDSGYVVCANGYYSPFNNYGVCLLFLNKNGDTTFSKWVVKEYYDYYDGWGGSFRKYSKGGFYLGGAIEDTSGAVYGVLFVFDQYGDTLWTKKYGNGIDVYGFYHARETPDKGFILAGTREIGINLQGLLIKTDSLGNVEWERNYGGNGVEYGTMVLPTSTGQYLLGGLSETSTCNFGGTDEWLVKTNSSGIQQWQKCYGSLDDEGNALPGYEFSNGDFAYVGQWAYITNRWYPYVSRIDNTGDTVWTKKMGPYGTSGFLRNMIMGNNDDILSVGQWSWANGIQGLMVRISSDGDSLWYRKYDYDPVNFANDELWDIDTAHSGGYVMCGSTNQGSKDVWVIKVDSHGCLFDPGCWLPGAYEEDKFSVGINDLEKENWFSVYPNPNNGKFYLENKIGIKPGFEVKIYSPIGEILFSRPFNEIKTELDISDFSIGIYFVTICDDSGVLWKTKIIKE